MEEFSRIQRLPPYVFNITDSMKRAARRSGEDIIDFGMGNPDGATPKHIVDKLVEAAQKPVLADEVLLAHELVEGARAHAGGQRGLALALGAGALFEHVWSLRLPSIHLRLSHRHCRRDGVA